MARKPKRRRKEKSKMHARWFDQNRRGYHTATVYAIVRWLKSDEANAIVDRAIAEGASVQHALHRGVESFVHRHPDNDLS